MGGRTCDQVEQEDDKSECSSGCQSGWTMYLDHSYDHNKISSFSPLRKEITEEEEEEEEDDDGEEEDLSMVSDASSGPPHFHGDELKLADNGGKNRRVQAEKQMKQSEPPSSPLDDTASSLFSFSKQRSFSGNINMKDPCDGLEFSSCFSATHFKAHREEEQEKKKKMWCQYGFGCSEDQK